MKIFVAVVFCVSVITTVASAQAPDTFWAGLDKRHSCTPIQQTLNQQYIIESPEESSNAGMELLFKGSLGAVYVGFGLPGNVAVEFLSVGIGFGFKRVGFLVTTKYVESFRSGYSDVGLIGFESSRFPIYLYFTYGLYSGKPKNKPVLYLYAGRNILESYNGHDYVCLGGGYTWRWWVTSPALEARWIREWRPGWDDTVTDFKDRISLGIKAELGGWWAKVTPSP